MEKQKQIHWMYGTDSKKSHSKKNQNLINKYCLWYNLFAVILISTS